MDERELSVDAAKRSGRRPISTARMSRRTLFYSWLKVDEESIEIGQSFGYFRHQHCSPWLIHAMFSLLRPILFPTLIASFFVVPLLYQKSTTMAPIERHQSNNRGIDYYGARSSQPYQSPPLNQSSGGLGTFSTSPLSNSSVTALPASTARPVTELPQLSAPAIPTLSLPSPSLQANSGGPFLPVSNSVVSSTPGVDFSQLTPDFGAAETYTFRGDANGPDLTSQPVQFVPISNFQEVFRFDVSPVWVKQRWDRLTAIPAEQGLHGLRTALVTGTNTWDLNGSLMIPRGWSIS